MKKVNLMVLFPVRPSKRISIGKRWMKIPSGLGPMIYLMEQKKVMIAQRMKLHLFLHAIPHEKVSTSRLAAPYLCKDQHQSLLENPCMQKLLKCYIIHVEISHLLAVPQMLSYQIHQKNMQNHFPEVMMKMETLRLWEQTNLLHKATFEGGLIISSLMIKFFSDFLP